MLQRSLKMAWRNALKNKTHALISLTSLILGFTFFTLILLWVKDELTYDRSFASSNICRVETSIVTRDGTLSAYAAVGWPEGRVLRAKYPEVEYLTYMARWAPVINFRGSRFYENAFYADNDFINVFGYSLEQGSYPEPLSAPFSLLISKSLKEKYFGNDEAVGKVLMVNDTIPYKITGVFSDLTSPSHLQFGMIASFSSYCSLRPADCQQEFSNGWFDVNVYNYVRLRKQVDVKKFSQKIKNLILTDAKESIAKYGLTGTLSLRPVKDIYLYSGLPTGTGPIGNIKLVKLFSLIGIFILLIACLNFINLTTAKSIERAKEIGIKKVLGSGKLKLVVQFLTESALMCFIAAVISFLFMGILIPFFNAFAGKNFTLLSLLLPGNILLLVAILVLIVPIAGFYPALVLSSYQPVKVLKGRFSHSGAGNFLRKALVVIQFSISLSFILSTIVIGKQMAYMQNQQLGFDKDKILLINPVKVPRMIRYKASNAYKALLSGQTGVINVTAADAVPGRVGWDGQFAYPEGRTKEEGSVVEYIPVDDNYINTLGLQLLAGHNFQPGNKEDEEQNLIINETAVKVFGWGNAENAIGKKLSTSGKEGRIIGVLKDYHQHGLQYPIRPVVLGIDNYPEVFAINYDHINPHAIVELARSAWAKVFAGYDFDYAFMDEDFQAQYSKEEKFKSLFEMAAGLSILIACLGLLGLAIFTAQKRTKEIGIRKVLGASVLSITSMLSKDFLLLIFIAILIASPLAWYCMHVWLQGFAYRIDVSWWMFPLAGFITIVAGFLTISFHAVKAALSNPVNSLRTE